MLGMLAALLPGQPAKPAVAGESAPLGAIVWHGEFAGTDWQAQWGVARLTWGEDNLSVVPDPAGAFAGALRVAYPAGSLSPSGAALYGRKRGGASFKLQLPGGPYDALALRYHVRFGEGFEFVRGGKLPGLYSGTHYAGGNIPDGTNGLSTRYMWRSGGAGEIYAYLPTSVDYGTSLGRGNWVFQPGRWYELVQVVELNDPDLANGRIRVWVDGTQLLDARSLTFRTTSMLGIEGLLFSTFHGGSDPTWAPEHDVYAEFADFSVMQVVRAGDHPALTGPEDGALTEGFAAHLTWVKPDDAVLQQVQVIPAHNDGPGVNVVLGAETTELYLPMAPEWYGLLPGMSYVWRVRSSSTMADPASNAGWSEWAVRRFRTPSVDATSITQVSPIAGATVDTLTPTLVWTERAQGVFYYEVQLSRDPLFNTNPATAVAPVYWNLVHGGQTTPPNSYTVPANAPLAAGQVHHWRVRPRIQGDGVPVAWSAPASFTAGAAAKQ